MGLRGGRRKGGRSVGRSRSRSSRSGGRRGGSRFSRLGGLASRARGRVGSRRSGGSAAGKVTQAQVYKDFGRRISNSEFFDKYGYWPKRRKRSYKPKVVYVSRPAYGGYSGGYRRPYYRRRRWY